MSLDMSGHIDQDFSRGVANRIIYPDQERVNGRWVEGSPLAPVPYNVNIQPLTDKEFKSIDSGGLRKTDFRKIYINNGDTSNITNEDDWTLQDLDGIFKVKDLDNRPSINYCKIVLGKEDE